MATGSSQYKYTNSLRQGGGGTGSKASKRGAKRSTSSSGGSYDSKGNYTDSSGSTTPF
jgi:hypothetical protein